ncbi:MAG: hypothetical protein QOJ07_2658, partial [Thermoleophilaceae bacterium]|nr:hypothetical protein [Thermoleophilaceae bacterium]
MSEVRARELIAALERAAPGRVVLWRGPELDSSDVDVLVASGAEHAAARVLRGEGLSPAPQEDGRVMWRSFATPGLVIDVLPGAAWPAAYPPLDGLLSRCARGGDGLLVTAPEDRLLIRAAEAVGGRELDHVARKVRPLLSVPGVRERVRELAAADGEQALAELILDPDALEAAAVSGRLPYRAAALVAARSPRARAALRGRASSRLGLGRRIAPPATAGPAAGAVVALSGMDGSGKSTAALELVARLEEQGRPALVAWSRLAADNELMDLIAGPVRKLLRRRGSTADPLAAGAPDAAGGDAPSQAGAGDRGPVEWVWVLIVAALGARALRRAARPARAGWTVVCDRWLTDALVDLDVRYGRHGAAEWLLRRAEPPADLALLLEIDAATSVARKPGDQHERVLAAMASRYAEVASELGFPPAGAPAAGDLVR